jgi:hypothetical protein
MASTTVEIAPGVNVHKVAVSHFATLGEKLLTLFDISTVSC